MSKTFQLHEHTAAILRVLNAAAWEEPIWADQIRDIAKKYDPPVEFGQGMGSLLASLHRRGYITNRFMPPRWMITSAGLDALQAYDEGRAMTKPLRVKAWDDTISPLRDLLESKAPATEPLTLAERSELITFREKFCDHEKRGTSIHECPFCKWEHRYEATLQAADERAEWLRKALLRIANYAGHPVYGEFQRLVAEHALAADDAKRGES